MKDYPNSSVAETRDEPKEEGCLSLQEQLLGERNLIIVSNRGPGTWQIGENEEMIFERGGGGLVTALLGLANRVQGTWISAALSDADRQWGEGDVPIGENGGSLHLAFVRPEPDAYAGYYDVISNPLLWFLQHSMWDLAHHPTITRDTWMAWQNGYVAVNQKFADAVARQIQSTAGVSLVMLQDYHLYLTPQLIREKISRSRRKMGRKQFILSFFIHIPWPGPEDWVVLPPIMRQSILESLCAVDLLGFQTRADAVNFLRTCEMLLPRGSVNYRRRRIWLHNHATQVRDFPISIDVEGLHEQAASEEVENYRKLLDDLGGGLQVILRIDRTEPSKNIVRGFQAYEDLFEMYPEHRNKVKFIALLVPSRLEVEEYQTYLDEINAAAGRVNARYGSSDWEPVRVLVGENYLRALGALQIYDVLLVNPVADGMNLVAKEGPTLNQKAGVIVLSERAGASQQLGEDALVISPFDVYETAQALHTALVMPDKERQKRAEHLKKSIEREDIRAWLCSQLEAINHLDLEKKDE